MIVPVTRFVEQHQWINQMGWLDYAIVITSAQHLQP